MFKAKEFEKYFKKDNYKVDSYYQNYAEKYVKYSGAIKWNWSSAFFNLFWLLYRKSYRGFIIVLLSILSIKAILGHQISGVMTPILFIIFGIFGNNLYFWDLKMKILNDSKSFGVERLWVVLLFIPFILLFIFFVGLNIFWSLIFVLPLIAFGSIFIGIGMFWLVALLSPIVFALIIFSFVV